MNKLFKELNPYFSIFILIKVFFSILSSWTILTISKEKIYIYNHVLLSIVVIVFLLKEKSRFIKFSMKLNKKFIPLLGISLLFSFSLILFFNKWDIFNTSLFKENKFINYYIYILVIPVFQGIFYRKFLLKNLSKVYGENCSILIMAAFLILFENQSIIKMSFLMVGLPFILGYLYLEENNIIKNITIHIFYNTLIIVFIKYFNFIKIPKSTLLILIIILFLSLVSEFKKIVRWEKL